LKLAYLETDASVDTRREVLSQDRRLFPSGAGIILRDFQLQPVVLKSVTLGPLPGPLHAEYLAFACGLEEAYELGVRGIWAMSDSERLVEEFHKRSENRAEGLRPIAERIERARARLGFVTLRWVPGSHRKFRFGGPSADALARAAVGLGKRK
jgi:ribonuclease HI